jgi:osmotically-inducible protein OsmY
MFKPILFMQRENLIPKQFHSLALLAVTSALLAAGPSWLRASETDTQIESSFRKSYVFKTYLKDGSITAKSENGAVTLTGTVAEESHKSLAQDTVESLPGVLSVDNRLIFMGETPAEHSDTWIGMKVKAALIFHRNVNAMDTDVYVKEGMVSLRGEASNLEQKELTAEYARDVEGVKGLRNEMTVAATPNQPADLKREEIDDASVTAQVKSSLRAHYSTSALKAKIVTMDGVVIVGGNATNTAQKKLVTKLVEDINGVTGVINNMTIEELESQAQARPSPVRNLRIVTQ